MNERDLIARFETAVVRWHEASLTDELEEYRAAHSALLAALKAGQREPDGENAEMTRLYRALEGIREAYPAGTIAHDEANNALRPPRESERNIKDLSHTISFNDGMDTEESPRESEPVAWTDTEKLIDAITEAQESGGGLVIRREGWELILAALQAAEREPDGWDFLSDDETDEASRIFDSLTRQGDPYAITRVVEQFLNRRRGTPPRESGEYDPEGLERAVQEYLEGMKYPDVRSHAIGIVKAYRGDRVDRAAHPPDFRSE